MYRLDREEFLTTPYIILWSVLGFQAGYINALGFLACDRYVSHVTGFGTQIGMEIGQKSFLMAIELLGFPLFFILGAFINGVLTSAKIEKGQKPRFDIVTLIIPFIIFVLYLFGVWGWFGPFGEDFIRARDFVLLYLLTFVCGLQNGCFAVLTRGQIRTTHLTGISTDIGTDFARMWVGKISGKERSLTRRTNISRLATFCFFATGSIASVLISQKYQFYSFAVPFFTSTSVFVTMKIVSRMLDKKFSLLSLQDQTLRNQVAK